MVKNGFELNTREQKIHLHVYMDKEPVARGSMNLPVLMLLKSILQHVSQVLTLPEQGGSLRNLSSPPVSTRWEVNRVLHSVDDGICRENSHDRRRKKWKGDRNRDKQPRSDFKGRPCAVS